MIGKNLGPYEIVAALGKGGMGEVWRARDTKLGRDVAIKTLPDTYARDPERLARFEREARFLATLDHPNIAGIHGLGESGDTRFLVMELVEGETLAERLEKGAISTEDGLGIATQIAQALEAAHAKGVIHRDLKPANIKITPEGRVKVLDFGLAKAFAPEEKPDGSDIHASNSPTLTVTASGHGVLLGTAAYMSPEQARGEAVDLRTDIWAFGCVLFEMLSGHRAFGGRTVSDILAAVLRAEPEWSLLPDGLHPGLRFLIDRCLRKDANERCPRVSEISADLDRVMEEPSGARFLAAGTSARPASRLYWAAAVALAVVISAAGASWLRPDGALPVMEFGFAPEEGRASLPPVPVLDYAPDSSRIAYSTLDTLWVREISETAPVRVSGPSGWIAMPAFDPTSQTIAYVGAANAGGPFSIFRVDSGGGTPRAIHSDLEAMPTALHWGDDGMLLYAQPDGIWEVAAAGGGNARRVVAAQDGDTLGSPGRLPNGDTLFTATSASGPDRWNEARIFVASPNAEPRLVLENGRDAHYLDDGYLVFARGATLWATEFSGGGRMSGTPFRALGDESLTATLDGLSDTAQVAVSDSGSLAYLVLDTAASAAGPRTLVWANRDGTVDPIDVPADDYEFVRISPDGARAVVQLGLFGSESEVVVLDLESEVPYRLPSDTGAGAPMWISNDTLMFVEQSPLEIFSVPASGGERDRWTSNVFGELGGVPNPWAFSERHGLVFLHVVYGTIDNVTDGQFFSLDLETRAIEPVLALDDSIVAAPSISSRGDWLAYIDNRTRIVLRPFPDVQRTEVDLGPGLSPVFSGDGTELFFHNGQGIAAVTIEYEPTFRYTVEEGLLVEGPYWYQRGGPNDPRGRAWDVDPNGERFLMISTEVPTPDPTAPTGELSVNVVVSFVEQLKERSR